MASADDYVFFWRTTDEHGYMAQWARSIFTGEDHPPSYSAKPLTYRSAEHYMMAHKAFLFEDHAAVAEILAASTPRAAKALGRKVMNFSEIRWLEEREEIVYRANLLKFSQHPKLQQRLLSTGNKKLVEASPKDRIWGIGFAEEGALRFKDDWGENLLGKALEKVRDELRNGPLSTIDDDEE